MNIAWYIATLVSVCFLVLVFGLASTSWGVPNPFSFLFIMVGALGMIILAHYVARLPSALTLIGFVFFLLMYIVISVTEKNPVSALSTFWFTAGVIGTYILWSSHRKKRDLVSLGFLILFALLFFNISYHFG